MASILPVPALAALLIAGCGRRHGGSAGEGGDSEGETDSAADTDSDADTGSGAPDRYAGEHTLGDEGTITFSADSSVHTLGRAVDFAGDVDGDGHDDLVVGVWDDDTSEHDAGAAYLFRGPTTVDRSLAEADAWFRPPFRAVNIGRSVAGAGDLDADGFDDVLAGGPGWTEPGAADGGAVWVLSGPLTGDVGLFGTPVWVAGSEDEADLGTAVAGVGDVDGDGAPDVLAGAPGAVEAGGAPGAAYLFRGPLAGKVDAAGADARLFGESDGDQAGEALAGAGDVDGDGLADLVVGAPFADATANWAGAAYVTVGPFTGDFDLGGADAVLLGEGEHDRAGSAVAGSGDVDGDGRDDVLVGAPGGDVAYLLLGPPGGTASLAEADAQFAGWSGTSAGAAVSGMGDLDLDGHTDVVIGAPEACDWAERGPAVFLLYGPVTGIQIPTLADANWVCAEDRGRAGTALASGGDLDGDGWPDLLVGAPQVTYPSRPSAVFAVLSSVVPR